MVNNSAVAKLEEKGYSFDTATFFEAVEKGDAEALQLFLNAGQNPYVKDGDGYTPLMNAVLYSVTSSVKTLLNNNIRLNDTNRYGKSAMLLASISGDYEICQMLLENGADANQADSRGETPIMQAARNRDKKLAELLLEYGADPEMSNVSGQSALDLASKRDDQEVLDLMTNYREQNEEEKDENGLDGGSGHLIASDELYTAIDKNDPDIINQLLDDGQNPELIGDHGYTPLMYAVMNEKGDAVDCLLARNVRIDRKNRYGNTALMIAVIEDDHNLVKKLIAHGANVNTRSLSGNTPLMKAIIEGDEELVNLLLEKGADPNISNYDGYTPLTWAVMKNSVEMVKILLDAGANPSVATQDVTPLERAKKSEFKELVSLLEQINS